MCIAAWFMFGIPAVMIYCYFIHPAIVEWWHDRD